MTRVLLSVSAFALTGRLIAGVCVPRVSLRIALDYKLVALSGRSLITNLRIVTQTTMIL